MKTYLIIGGGIIGVLLLVFFATFALSSNQTGKVIASNNDNAIISGDSIITLKVNIPCPGHASLISNSLKSLDGVKDVKFSVPNVFNVSYDSSKINKSEILSLNIFQEYPAEEI